MYLFLLFPLTAVLTYGVWRLLGRTKFRGIGRLLLSLLLGAVLSALLLWCVIAVSILMYQWNDPVGM